jgi:hypothetical protein
VRCITGGTSHPGAAPPQFRVLVMLFLMPKNSRILPHAPSCCGGRPPHTIVNCNLASDALKGWVGPGCGGLGICLCCACCSSLEGRAFGSYVIQCPAWEMAARYCMLRGGRVAGGRLVGRICCAGTLSLQLLCRRVQPVLSLCSTTRMI